MMEQRFTMSQINKMKHAIGFDNDRVTGRKHRKYKAYRNYYTTGKPEKELDELVEQNLMIGRPYPNGCGEDPHVYFVSVEGMMFLSKLTGVQITEMD